MKSLRQLRPNTHGSWRQYAPASKQTSALYNLTSRMNVCPCASVSQFRGVWLQFLTPGMQTITLCCGQAQLCHRGWRSRSVDSKDPPVPQVPAGAAFQSAVPCVVFLSSLGRTCGHCAAEGVEDAVWAHADRSHAPCHSSTCRRRHVTSGCASCHARPCRDGRGYPCARRDHPVPRMPRSGSADGGRRDSHT